MKKQFKIVLVLALLVSTAYMLYYYSNYRLSQPVSILEESDLKKSKIAYYDTSSIHKNFNLIYSPAWQYAQKALQSKAENASDLKIDSMPEINVPNYDKWLSLNNSFIFYVDSFHQSTEALISELADKHLNKVSPVSIDSKTGEYLLFSHTDAQIVFKNNFRVDQQAMPFMGRNVKCLNYLEDDKNGKKPLLYEWGGLQLIEISDGKGHEIQLIKIPAGPDLGSVSELCNKIMLKGTQTRFNENFRLKLPLINFLLKAMPSFYEKSSVSLDNNNMLLKAIAKYDFSINAEFSVFEKDKAKRGPDTERSFVFNSPFYMRVKSEGSERYHFILWIANSELLVPYAQGS